MAEYLGRAISSNTGIKARLESRERSVKPFDPEKLDRAAQRRNQKATAIKIRNLAYQQRLASAKAKSQEQTRLGKLKVISELVSASERREALLNEIRERSRKLVKETSEVSQSTQSNLEQRIQTARARNADVIQRRRALLRQKNARHQQKVAEQWERKSNIKQEQEMEINQKQILAQQRREEALRARKEKAKRNGQGGS